MKNEMNDFLGGDKDTEDLLNSLEEQTNELFRLLLKAQNQAITLEEEILSSVEDPDVRGFLKSLSRNLRQTLEEAEGKL